MALTLTAYLDQRFQWTADVTAVAAIYSGSIGSAVWRLQIRPQPGSPVVTLDFKTGGSPQSSNLTATYNSGPHTVVFRAPTSIIALLAAGTYYFDYGFVLPSADFERVDGGTIQFVPGVTLAGVTGSPAAPSGADDTVR